MRQVFRRSKREWLDRERGQLQIMDGRGIDFRSAGRTKRATGRNSRLVQPRQPRHRPKKWPAARSGIFALGPAEQRHTEFVHVLQNPLAQSTKCLELPCTPFALPLDSPDFPLSDSARYTTLSVVRTGLSAASPTFLECRSGSRIGYPGHSPSHRRYCRRASRTRGPTRSHITSFGSRGHGLDQHFGRSYHNDQGTF
jgi:hypothetical protein